MTLLRLRPGRADPYAIYDRMREHGTLAPARLYDWVTTSHRKAVAKCKFVLTLIGAANRDPGVYDYPDTFDIQRDGAPAHLAFGSGIHYCIGQPLARLEATVAFQMLAERMPGLSRTGTVRGAIPTVSADH